MAIKLAAFFFMAVALGFGQAVVFQRAPRTVSKEAVENPPAPVPQITRPTTNTTPSLSQNEEAIHLGMQKDISTQGQKVDQLRVDIDSLSDKRERVDRPDIDSLKDWRSRLQWTWAFLAAGFSLLAGLIWKFR
jgi:hypothetical protein